MLLFAQGCGVRQAVVDLRQVRRKDGYSLQQLREDLAAVRSSCWPDRGGVGILVGERWWYHGDALSRVFGTADWAGVTRDAALRMLGPADGELAYREVEFERELQYEGETIKDITKDKRPYLVEPGDDQLIYRTGDGNNHNAIYTLHFRNGSVSEVDISAGY